LTVLYVGVGGLDCLTCAIFADLGDVDGDPQPDVGDARCANEEYLVHEQGEQEPQLCGIVLTPRVEPAI